MRSQIMLLDVRRNWTPPEGLDHSRPREVALTLSGKIVVALAFVLLAVSIGLGVTLGIVASRDARDARLLRREGVVTSGEITRIWRSGSKDRQPWISYRFTGPARAFDRNARVPLRLWQGLQVGSVIPIRYAQSDPLLSFPLGLEREPMPPWLPFVVGFSVALISPLLFLSIARQRRLLAEGRPAPALVTRHGPIVRSQHGQKLGMRFDYEFPVLSGAIVKGKAGPAKTPPAVGSTITVLYEPENPRRSAPYPLPSPLVKLAYRGFAGR